MLSRRALLQIPAVSLVANAAATPQTSATGLCFNEDNSHYFYTRGEHTKTFTVESVASWVDQYAGTQVRELILNPNSQRTSFASKVWDPIWKGYDPNGPDDQPMLASTAKDSRAGVRRWIHAAWQLHQQDIDPYAVWIRRARQKNLRPWISMRMNDLHNVDDPQSFMHSTFWREHPEFRRMNWRTPDWRDRAFDFNHAAVRDYHFRLVEEYCERYDFDGLELDWMRFGFHFKPGEEQPRGSEATTEFMRRTRALLNVWEKKRGHKIALGARVPTRPQTAWAMGMDGARWAQLGLIQMLVVTPFWASIETDIPIEQWRRLIGPNVTLAAGLELLLRPYHDYKIQSNTIETVRGAAASLLARGADRIYLFNYMDSQTAMPDTEENYGRLLRECGSLATLAGQPRRHVVTYADTWAPGEAQGAQLPKTVRPGGWAGFRLFVGPRMERGAVLRMEVAEAVKVHWNGAEKPLTQTGEVAAGRLTPGPVTGAREWKLGVVEGWVVIDVKLPDGGKIHWVEIASA